MEFTTAAFNPDLKLGLNLGLVLAATLAATLALAVAAGGLRLWFGARGRIRAVQRLYDGRMDGARGRIAQLETALAEAETARLRAQQDAVLGRRRHADLMAAVSRQIRVPLETVLGFSDLLRLNAASEPLSHRQSQAMDRIGEAAARLLALVEGMDVLAGAERPAPVARRPADPLLLARQACARLAPAAAEAGVALRPPPPQSGLTVLADPERLDRALTSLIAHALRRSPRGAAVTIEGRRDAGAVLVTVGDAGPGLSPARLAALFEPFASAGPDGAPNVGLAAARRLAGAMQGGIEADSPRGEGLVLTLRLAAAGVSAQAPDPGEAAATPPRAPPAPRPPCLPQGVLLYVARDAAAVAMMRRLTQDFGRLQLHVARSPDEGTTLARDLRPDALILDLDLVADGGAAFLAELRADGTMRDLPVLALTTADCAGPVEGFVEVLRRPAPVSELAAVLVRALGPARGRKCASRG